ncbi:MAG: DNA repair protein RecN [Bacteroidales bacterium]|nr:DNA repair protein RecN [Bacteroidales bacterium]MDD2322333.1 DNA repair protein RecN [Bacteroidales bacterium]MDD3009881.1 DNA repair protein RecN [Bacteroidales bacterium]MDD3961472.1 DNA repair protein RecN [Bacteroidales bacterium]MDY0285155.1 DNA repair protein RecN [Bacteroidales bacterium]
MLSHLFITNYALIDKLDIDFPEGFISITGETGAGKSILLGAIGLILGNRADTSVLHDLNKKCIIEGTFFIENYSLQSFFYAVDIDYEPHTIVRREILPAGKSRAFINDTPVSLKDLKALGDRLIDIHGQFSTLRLADTTVQLSMIDEYAQSAALLTDYQSALSALNTQKKELKEIEEKVLLAKREEDYLLFAIQQIEEVNADVSDIHTLESRRKVLENAESIKSTLYYAAGQLYSNEENIVSTMNSIHRNLNAIASLDPKYNALNNRIASLAIETSDIGFELENLNNELVIDPREIEMLTERLDQIYALQHKFQVNTMEELLLLHSEMKTKISQLEAYDDKINDLRQRISLAEKKVEEVGSNLSRLRNNAINPFCAAIRCLLDQVNLSDASFSVQNVKMQEPGKEGYDQVSFLFSANKGVAPAEIHKVASGGELSRLMLAIKAVLSGKKKLPTILFDEIESGVSGAAAGKIAGVLADMGKTMQVIAITHLPQIAGKSTHQYHVTKKTPLKKTYSEMRLLNPDERIEALALMLSDGHVTVQARDNARAILKPA